MIYSKKIHLSLWFLLAFSASGLGQHCSDFHKTSACRKNIVSNFRYFSQSRSNEIKFGMRLKYDMVFYGEQEYMISFCTEMNFYPVHYILKDGMTGEAFYDNKDDDYKESIAFALERTRRIIVEVEILANNTSDKEKKRYYPCIGMYIQFRELDE